MALLEVKPDPRPASTAKPKRRTVADQAAAGLFKEIVCASPCIGEQLPGHVCEFPLQAAHVISKQTLRKRGLGHLIYDPVNGVAACYRLHRRHDNWVEKIPRGLLPPTCVAWAEAHGLAVELERAWPA